MVQIDIATVLKRTNITIDDDRPQVFSIDFVKTDGTIRHIKVASVAHKPGKEHKSSRLPNVPKKMYNLKDKGSILIYNHDTSEYNTVKIPLIVRFNSMKVWH
jgi:phage regulator Rha-like protein